MKLDFFVPGEPQGKGRPRFRQVPSKKLGGKGFVQTYTPASTVVYENAVKIFASQAIKGLPPTDKPIFVIMDVVFSPPDSWSKKKKLAAIAGEIHHDKKPDGDNIQKAVFDGLQGIVVIDDKQIYGHALLKRYGLTPGVRIQISDLYPKGWFPL